MADPVVYLAIVLYNDARAERALIFGLGAGCMAAAVLLRNRRSRFATKLSPQISLIWGCLIETRYVVL